MTRKSPRELERALADIDPRPSDAGNPLEVVIVRKNVAGDVVHERRVRMGPGGQHAKRRGDG